MWMDTTDPGARWPENLRFTGDLTDEVDENWNQIVEDRYFSVSEAEAIEAWGDRRHEYVDEELGGYTAGLDVFHTLHCLVSWQVSLLRRVFDVNLKTEQSEKSHLPRPLRPRVISRDAKSPSRSLHRHDPPTHHVLREHDANPHQMEGGSTATTLRLESRSCVPGLLIPAQVHDAAEPGW